MTGIDRLRTLAGAWGEWGLGGTLAEIADEIERELREERDRWDDDLSEAEVSWNAVAGVCLDMERHCLGHEGMEDSPVTRWARELRKIVRQDGGDSTGNDPCHSPATDEDRDAAAWVRDHGGLDHVRAEWRSRVPYDRYVRRRQSLLGHIAECETALGRRNRRIEELGHRVSDLTNENAELRKRAMPEGMAWPKHTDGTPVCIGDSVVGRFSADAIKVRSVEFRDGDTYLREGCKTDRTILVHPGERVKRPADLASDGVPLEVGQTVWDTDDETDTPLTVVEVSSDLIRCEYTWKDGKTYRPCYPPDVLTHTKPELQDSAERIAEDIRRMAEEWCSYPSLREASEKAASSVGEATMGVALGNLSKRCRALAERERGE